MTGQSDDVLRHNAFATSTDSGTTVNVHTSDDVLLREALANWSHQLEKLADAQSALKDAFLELKGDVLRKSDAEAMLSRYVTQAEFTSYKELNTTILEGLKQRAEAVRAWVAIAISGGALAGSLVTVALWFIDKALL